MRQITSIIRLFSIAFALCAIYPQFANAAGQNQDVVNAAAAVTDYHLASGDKIHIAVLGEEALTNDYVISGAGNLLFPLIGNVDAKGLTIEQLQQKITTALNDGYFKNAQVTIQTLSYLPFYILGEVAHPGPYPVTTGMTLEQAVSTAGGFTYRANKHYARLRHARETAEQDINIRKPDSLIISAGDTIRILERHF
jgi:protein involved in polysaccharide export with SLBB domain